MSLQDLAEMIGQATRGALHTAMPARVVSFDPNTQTATVQPTIRFARVVDDGGSVGIEQYQPPPIPHVPVAFFRSGAGSIYCEPVAGDKGLLMVQERSTDEWRAQGNADTTPADPRRFDLSDAVFLPSVSTPADPLASSARAAGALVLAHASSVLLGAGTATSAVALAPLIEAFFAEDKIWKDLHVHLDPLTGTTGPPSAPSPSTPSVGASRVKAV